MSQLTIYSDTDTTVLETRSDGAEIAARLDQAGVLFERWATPHALADDADQDAILSAYADSVQRLKDLYSFQSADVISLKPDHPDKDALRAKFLDEHTHSEYEVRFFVRGKGVFYIHKDSKVFTVLCEQGDLISVPANTTHWFDMGPAPDFTCIRLFTTPEGWVANFTGNPIAQNYPRFDAVVE
jgi:1,2-dihydroxy-3-keto-5-methylthiopentene dioxygenase